MPAPSPPETPDPAPRAESERSARPMVGLPRPGLPGWMIILGIALAAVLLFSVLEARRQSLSAPSVEPRPADALATAAPPPPLYLPPEEPRRIVVVEPPPPPTPPAPPPRIIYVPQPVPAPAPAPVEAPPPAPRPASESALVVDTTTPDAAPAAAASGDAAGAAPAVAMRARASVLRNRATTVPQGTLIPAVLETALDSTRPGPARALVTRDVRGFDGSKVLIPRGSRLTGDYKADLAAGQNRAQVTWNRLVRPDGVAIAIGSPAADTLGRVGVRGKVNSHFFERFAGAILQSSLDIGVNLASQLGGAPVVIGIPGVTGVIQTTTAPLINTAQIQPTLRVRQGTAISVFVARDLDFTSVASRP